MKFIPTSLTSPVQLPHLGCHDPGIQIMQSVQMTSIRKERFGARGNSIFDTVYLRPNSFRVVTMGMDLDGAESPALVRYLD